MTQPTVELEVPPKVPLGDTVEVILRVRNDGSEPLALELPGRPVAFDVVIMGPDGTEVWRRLHDAVVTSALMLLRLEPGEARKFTARWPQVDRRGRPVAPGRYTVQGILPIGSRRLTSAPRDVLIGS